MGRALLGQGHRAGIEVKIAFAADFPGGKMGVPVEEDISRTKRRQRFGVVMVAVGGKNAALPHHHQAVVRQNGQLQHHLIHLTVAIAPNAEDFSSPGVEQLRHLHGGVSLGQRIPGAVIQKVTQKQQAIRTLPVKGVKEFAAPVGRAVKIRGDHQFHGNSSDVGFFNIILQGKLNVHGISSSHFLPSLPHFCIFWKNILAKNQITVYSK